MIFFTKISSSTWNVVYMSICYLILFTADLTIINLEKTVISSIHDDNEDFNVDGYNLLALLYLSFGIFLWLGPSTIKLLGVRTSMVVASSFYTIYIFSFALEKSWVLYTATAIGGIGAGFLWAAEGKYLVSNSTLENVSRNIGIFWTLFCISSFFGNLITYFKFKGKKYIDKESRQWLVYSLTATAAVATVAFIFLRPVKKDQQQNATSQESKSNALSELKKTWNVFKTKEMLILCMTFGYTGLQQAFNQGIYSPSIGFTLQFGNEAKQLVPLSGLFIGVGQFIGGCWQILQGQLLTKIQWGRRIIILTGVIAQFLSYILIFINIPLTANFGNTSDKAIIESNAYIALFCSLLLGVGDGCLNTQNFSIIAMIFPNESAQSCALYKFVKAMFVAVGFTISSHLNLHYQIELLTIVGILALIAFIFVDISYEKSCKNKNTEIKT